MEGQGLHAGEGLPDSIPEVLAWKAFGHERETWKSLAPGFSALPEWFGPEITLVQRLAQLLPTDTFALIKVALGATTLESHWRSPSGGDSTGFLYSKLVEAVASAQATHPLGDFPLSGFFWMQGESDAVAESSAVSYGQRLEAFILDLRETWSDSTMPWVLGLIDVQPAWPWANTVREATSGVASKLPRIGLVETVGLGTDGVHYDAAGTKRLGTLFADRWLAEKGLLPTTRRQGYVEVRRVSQGRVLLKNLGPDPILEVRFITQNGRTEPWTAFHQSLVLGGRNGHRGVAILQVRRRSGSSEAFRVPLF